MSGLWDNCRNSSSWPHAFCAVGNISGFFSAALWFLVLVPQIVKNFRRRSVVGLSFLWAAANFTASLINLFFVFSRDLPLYINVQSIYQPCLELIILFQFLLFSKNPVPKRLLALLICLLLWSVIIEVELNVDEAATDVYWVAVFLWSVETFPQVILNMKRRSTSGQSTVSVGIALTGKVTDFIATYSLAMPIEFVIMAYFSSSSAYINGFQVFWYGIKEAKKQNTTSTKAMKNLAAYFGLPCISDKSSGSTPSSPTGSIHCNDIDEKETLIQTVGDVSINSVSEPVDEVDKHSSDDEQEEVQEEPTLPLTPWRIVGLIYCSVMLTGFACGLAVGIGAWWAVWGPVIIVMIVTGAYLHRSYREGKLDCTVGKTH